MDDRELVEAIQRGEREYLNVIAKKYYDDIFRFCCYHTGDMEESYDLAQETFLRFIRYVDRYRYKNLKGYLLTIAMNVCRDYFRRKKNQELVGLEAWEAEAGGYTGQVMGTGVGQGARGALPLGIQERGNGASGDPGQEVLNRDEADRLWSALGELPDFQREVLILHCYYGFRYREIGKMLGVKTATVKSRMKQGTEKLKRRLRREDFQ